MMARFKVVTTAYCGNCKFIKNYVRENQLENFEFVDAHSPEGKELINQYGIRNAGTIIDTELGQICRDIREFK